MNLRVYGAFFAGITMVMSIVLASVAYFGDKNPRWAARLILVAAIAALVFVVAIFYGV